MIKKSVTAQDVIDLLNSMVAVDPMAVSLLVDARVPCGNALGDHPTVQCGQNTDPETKDVYPCRVGLLGVLNGLFGTIESGPHAEVCELADARAMGDEQRRPGWCPAKHGVVVTAANNEEVDA